METMNIDEMIEVLKAHKDGKVIQYSSKDSNWNWCDAKPYSELSWNFYEFKYRVKPELKEFWINLYDDDTYPNIFTGYTSKEKADRWAGKDRSHCIHVREVLDD